MSGSVGTVKIPIVSTFDASGVQQAKAGLKELQQSQGGGGGGGSSEGGGSASPGNRAPSPSKDTPATSMSTLAKAAGSRLSQIASSIPGAEGLGNLLGSAALGPAAAGVAVFALSQHVASNAAQVRKGALDLGVSVDYYGKLEKSARMAGITIGEVTAGIGGARDKVLAASTGGSMGESVFLQSLGLTQADMREGAGNAEYLANRLSGMHLTGGQKAAVFGSIQAADAIMGSGKGSTGGIFDANAAETMVASQMKVGADNLATNIMGRLGFFFSESYSGKSYEQIGIDWDKKNDQAEAQQRAEQQAKLEKALQAAGSALLPSLASPADTERYTRLSRQGFIYSANGQENERYRNLADLQAREQRLGAESGLISPWEQADREMAIATGKRDNKGYSSDYQAESAMIGIQERKNAALTPVRSKYENLEANLKTGQDRWNNESELGGWHEREATARKMGLQVQDYADSMTHAGGLAGAADMSSVGGYSQLVAAQEQMRQSSDSRAMAEMLLQQLPHAIAQAIRENFGFQFRRPMGPMN
jgi:hypothetical protein